MGIPTELDFTRAMQTRGGSAIKIYEIFESDYINGAWYEDERDIWYPCQWGWDGLYAAKPSALDLVNRRHNGRKAA